MSQPTTLQEIYTAHSGMVYSLALSYLQHKEDAEEVTQDVFIKVHEGLADYKKQASLKTWIYRITVNYCLDFIKAKRRKKRSTFFNTVALDKVTIPSFEHPGVLLEQREMAAVLLECVNELKEQQKTAFILSKVDGLKHEEIAEIMSKSVSGVESLIYRAKQNLQVIIGKKWSKYRKK